MSAARGTLGLVLAGGLARRMGGGDKALIRIGEETILDRTLARFKPQCARVILNANGDPARFSSFGLPVVPDSIAGFAGPLAGVLAGLRWAEAASAGALLVAPGDAPFLPAGLAARLTPGPAYAVTGGRAHPLALLLPVAASVPLADWLGAGRPRRVRAFLGAVGARAVEFGEGSGPLFLNVNTPAELEAAEAAVRRSPGDHGAR